MIGHKIGFKGVFRKIILKLSLLPHLIWSTEVVSRVLDFEIICLGLFLMAEGIKLQTHNSEVKGSYPLLHRV